MWTSVHEEKCFSTWRRMLQAYDLQILEALDTDTSSTLVMLHGVMMKKKDIRAKMIIVESSN